MKTIQFTLIALGLVLVAAPAAAQIDLTPGTPYTLTAIQDEGQWKWEGENGEINPSLVAAGGEEYTITACGGGSSVPHNIKVLEAPVSDTFDGEDCIDYTFTMPAEGAGEYICTIHPNSMLGVISTPGAAAVGEDGGDEEGNDTPAPGLVGAAVALVGTALVLRRK